MERLLGAYLWWHRRLKWINYHLDDGGLVGTKRMLQSGSNFFRLLDRPSQASAGVRILREVWIVQLAAVLRIAEENNLLPLDLAQCVVLDNDDDDWQVVFHRGEKFTHQHGEAAIANEGDRLSFGKRQLRRDCIRQAWRHRRQIA